MVPPEIMCRQHLLGEHVEMHMFAGAIRKGTSMAGYLDGGLLEPRQVKYRHDRLVEEMERRGMNHRSPMQEEPWIPGKGKVSPFASLQELLRRCPDCQARFDARMESQRPAPAA